MTDVNYMFSAEPRPVQVAERKQPKYRDPVNIMYDKRVVRGPTYRTKLDLSATITPITQQQQQSKPHTKPTQPHHQHKPLASPHHQLVALSSPHAHTQSAHVQTDDYLEELTDEVYEADGATQTDAAYLPAASDTSDASGGSILSLPMFAPKPAGVDAGTAIEALELFDYDRAVLPLLATLVGKALEQAAVEVAEEEELAALEAARGVYEKSRQLAVAEVSRLELGERRRVAEKQARFESERARLVREQHLADKRRAMEAADGARRALQEAERARQRAEAKDPVREAVVATFVPWLLAAAQAAVAARQAAGVAVEAAVAGAVVGVVGEGVAARRRREEEAAAERARLVAVEAARLEAEEAERRRVAEAKRVEEERVAAEEAARLAAEEAEASKAEEDGEEED